MGNFTFFTTQCKMKKIQELPNENICKKSNKTLNLKSIQIRNLKNKSEMDKITK